MDKYYTLNEIAMFTGLTTRTLRNYVKMGILSGEKIDGIWQFTEEEVNEFCTNQSVKPSIEAKNNAIVYDFLIDKKKCDDEICSIIDLCIEEEAKDVSEYFCNEVNKLKMEDIKLSFEKNGKNVRVILKGSARTVLKIVDGYYS